MSPPSKAEQRLDRWFGEQLSDPFVVYRNVAWLTKADADEPRDGEADFVIAHPELGILVIEVKGGGIRRTGGRWESVDRTGTAHPIKDPFAQVTREVYSLKRIAEGRPDWPAHEVRFCRAVAFADIRYETALQRTDRRRSSSTRRTSTGLSRASARSSTGGPRTPREGGAVGRPARSA